MEHKGTGRTSRMLAFALAAAKAKKNVVIYGKDVQHTLMLRHQFIAHHAKTKKQRTTKWCQRVHFSSFSDLTRADNMPFQRGYDGWNDTTGTIKPGTKIAAGPQPVIPLVHLVDHFALEQRLDKVQHYLEVAARIGDPALWVIQTARMMASTGKHVTVITEDPQITTDLCNCWGIHLGDLLKTNIDWVNMRFKGPADDPRVLIFDPAYIAQHFSGTLKEAQRWNQ